VVPIAHANDGGGSIRIPASCCGLVGLKPTRGRVTVAPDLGDAVDGLAIDHVVTRSVRDSAAALDAIAGNVPGDPYWAPPAPPSWLAALEQEPRRLRIAFSSLRLDGSAMHPECEAAVRQAARLCAGLGHEVEEAAQHFDLSVLVPAFLVVWSANLAAAVDLVARQTGQTPLAELFEGLTWGMYEAGRRVGASEYLVAKDALQCASRGAAKFHETHDVWLMPTLGTPPMENGVFNVEERDIHKGFLPLFDYVPFTAFQNVTGQPAMNLPLFWNKEGLPIGVQFAAPFGDEKTLFQLARQLEEAAPWHAHYAQVKV
jgi:amidase